MALTVAAAAPAAHIRPRAAPPPPVAQPAAAAGSTRQQQAALNQLLNKYRAEQSQGLTANTLSALGKQIVSAAQALGQHVTLPRAPVAAAPTTGAVNLTV